MQIIVRCKRRNMLVKTWIKVVREDLLVLEIIDDL